MTFLCNTTISKEQTSHIYNFHQYATLQKTGLYNRAVDINSFPIFNSTNYSERPCLYTSGLCKGSVTIEAAIGFPIFFLVTLSLLYIINIMYIQTTLQIALDEAVRNASQTAYITAEFYSLSTEKQSQSIDDDSSILENIGASALSIAYLRDAFLTDEIEQILDNSPIIGGSSGISFSSSSIDLSAYIADIILTYTVSIPFIPDEIFSLTLSNRCYVRLYTGKDMAKEQTVADTYVYYTTTGKVYHFNRYCRYLLNYTEAARYLDISRELLPCTMCNTILLEKLKEDNPVVYVTQSNFCYHTTLECQSFTGMVFRRDHSSLDDNDRICEECLKGK